MPLSITTTGGGTAYQSPIISPVVNRHHIKVDLSGLTFDAGSGGEVDADGYLRPGVPLRLTGGLGVLISGGSQVVDGVTIEATKLPITTPVTAASLAAETGDCLVAVATHVTVNRDLAEDVLGRAYSANEIAAMDAAFVYLTST